MEIPIIFTFSTGRSIVFLNYFDPLNSVRCKKGFLMSLDSVSLFLLAAILNLFS